jgi:hypothetical protein
MTRTDKMAFRKCLAFNNKMSTKLSLLTQFSSGSTEAILSFHFSFNGKHLSDLRVSRASSPIPPGKLNKFNEQASSQVPKIFSRARRQQI